MSAAVVIGSLPFLIGSSITPRGAQFYGNKIIAPGDYSIYYSYIEQGRQGRVFMDDAFTSEPHPATLFQPLWFIVGMLARLLDLSGPLAFALARLAATPLLIVVIWWTIRWLWPSDRRVQRGALLLSLFASGLGGLAAVLAYTSADGSIWTFPDLWVSEAFTTLTLWSSAHFILVTTGILFVLVAVERSWQERRWSLVAWAGVTALGVFSIHPFHLITWAVFWVGLTLWRTIVARRVPWGFVGRWVTVIAIGSPMLILFGTQLFFDPLTVGRAAQNINLTGPVVNIVVGLGLLLFGAGVGAWRWRPRDERWRWVVALAIAYLVAIYLPVSFQRRLSQGLVIPFALLAAPAVTTMIVAVRRRIPSLSYVSVAGLAVLLTSSWVLVGALVVKDYTDELQGRRKYMYYVTPEHQQIAAYLRTTDRHQPLFTSLLEGNVLAGLTAHQVFVGYGVETIDFERKLALVDDFYGRMGATEQRRLLSDWRLCYVMASPWTRGYGTAFQPETWPDLTLVWSGPTSQLYRTPFCR